MPFGIYYSPQVSCCLSNGVVLDYVIVLAGFFEFTAGTSQTTFDLFVRFCASISKSSLKLVK